MSRLIHLNGPSGVEKSNLARMYADRHPGVLDLDTDQVVCLIGGWQDSFWQTLGADGGTGLAPAHQRSCRAVRWAGAVGADSRPVGRIPSGPAGHVVVDTDDLDSEQTYSALVAALG
jgi:hypothetical protein